MSKEINFQVLRDGGQVVGFSLVPNPETLSELFCKRLQRGLVSGKAEIKIEVEEIIFSIPDGQKRDEFRAKVAAEDLIAIVKLLAADRAKDPELIIRDEPFDLTCYGFRVTLPGYENIP
ncbi:MAG: hypothetical protein A3J62_00160 [Candidatus Buchananbacteria bacterium RIFCSPHIGHO2_02_FULL_38_8]|uniref:Uncharacterized protein n=1 Tax=Candidatus Buchananbacteria bacterium RIFCSPHIGHO2_02_FULL_38_8 TaxID=1797538 RepID=A0A1G1Y5H5_9BACT|nr:hypothetical protein [uncultured bacterium]OGY47589.1 MAG: hypothetical protein A3J62_00160 [Candidatus Buchananbacteria bacterium RIFCSPHIGHO2_02_FULL_38_8]